MTDWYVRRNDQGAIESAWSEIRPGYAEELLTDESPEIVAYFKPITNPVPQEVSAAQIIRALAQLNDLETVDAIVAQADELTQRLWARSGYFSRTDPLLLAVATAAQKDANYLDDLFRLAGSL